MFFDARAAKLLKPGEHLVIEGCLGLRLAASVSRKTWTYRYKASDGRMKQVALGHWPAVSVQAAAARWQEVRDKKQAGIDPAAQRKQKREAKQVEARTLFTARQLVQDFMDGHIDVSRKTAGALAANRALIHLLEEEPAFAQMPAASVTRAVAFDLLDARKATPTAAAKLRSLLGAAWDYALDSGRLDGDVPNWWRQVMKGKLKSKGKILKGEHVGQQRRVLRPVEVGVLLAWLPNLHVLGRDCLQMYLWTCARGVEFLGMRAEHVTREPDGLWWTIPKALTKNARFAGATDLRVPLECRALEIVERRLAALGKSGWLFEDVRGEQYTQQDFSTYIYNLQPYSSKTTERQGAGLVLPVTHWTPHDLRRTGRTFLASLGCPDEIGEAIIGHLPKDIVGTYNRHSYDIERRHWLGRLSAHLEGLTLCPR